MEGDGQIRCELDFREKWGKVLDIGKMEMRLEEV